MVKIKRANWKRLASLSALGAGALSVSGSTAEASSIVYSAVGGGVVTGTGNILGPNGASAFLKDFYCVVTCFTLNSALGILPKAGAKGTTFRLLATKSQFLALGFPAHAVWSTNFQGKSTKSADLAFWGTRGSGTEFTSTDRYLLFRFVGGALPNDTYGWAEINLQGDSVIQEWAYDTSGAELPAGDTSTPEPSTFALTGLAALALGAKGLRTWRAARKAAAEENALQL